MHYHTTQRFTRLVTGLLNIAQCGRLKLQVANLVPALRKCQGFVRQRTYAIADWLHPDFHTKTHTPHSVPAERCQVAPPGAATGCPGAAAAHELPAACLSALLSGHGRPQHSALALRSGCNGSASVMTGTAARAPRLPG